MGFRLVPKLVTLNDLERRNGRIRCVILPNSVAFGAYYVKVVEDTPSTAVAPRTRCECIDDGRLSVSEM